jgi:hypothetical protein
MAVRGRWETTGVRTFGKGGCAGSARTALSLHSHGSYVCIRRSLAFTSLICIKPLSQYVTHELQLGRNKQRAYRGSVQEDSASKRHSHQGYAEPCP